jgi:hypothetical protein
MARGWSSHRWHRWLRHARLDTQMTQKLHSGDLTNWVRPALFHFKVDTSVPQTQHVNLSIVGTSRGSPSKPGSGHGWGHFPTEFLWWVYPRAKLGISWTRCKSRSKQGLQYKRAGLVLMLLDTAGWSLAEWAIPRAPNYAQVTCWVHGTVLSSLG